jgi:D-alanine--poly(phosphoribitol) ligase subunit 2
VSDNAAILDSLRAIFVENLGIEPPAPEEDLLASGILDSFQVVELLLQLESRLGFAIKLEDFDLDDLRTLAGVARIVANGSGGVGARAPSSG